MNIKDQLPYLGEELDDGTIKIGEHIILDKDEYGNRPDYKSFRSEIPKSEFTCAGVLIGIRGIQNCKNVVDEALKKISINYPEILDHPEGKVYFDLLWNLHEIREMIKLGVGDGKIKEVKLKEDPLFSDLYFKTNIYYNPVQFLKWAKICNFPMPDELKFDEREDGKIIWLSDDEDNQSKSTVGKEDKIEHWANIAINFCSDMLENNGQLPTKDGVASYIEEKIKKQNEKLGKSSHLPDAKFRKIWNKIPSEYKRKIGEITKR